MALMARYPDKYFELAIVDPPYGIGEDGSKNHSRGKRAKAKDYKGFSGNDTKPMSKDFFIELQRVSVNQIIWGANHFIENIPAGNSSCWIVWNKKNGETDFADCELAYTSFDTAVRMFEFNWNGMWQEDMKNKETRIHPTQKPVALYKWLLHKYAKQGDKILDCFLGSGSIAIACHDYGFDLTACELDTDYYNAAMKRIAIHTAQLKLF
jgi:site-specific DNA-methyltransferase (adenine-specific)